MPLAWTARLLAVRPSALATLLGSVALVGCIPADPEDLDRLVFVDAGLAAGDSLREPTVS